ncbi:hypothetical protein HaLaN_30604, partial [Haematococcus lacustris]
QAVSHLGWHCVRAATDPGGLWPAPHHGSRVHGGGQQHCGRDGVRHHQGTEGHCHVCTLLRLPAVKLSRRHPQHPAVHGHGPGRQHGAVRDRHSRCARLWPRPRQHL